MSEADARTGATDSADYSALYYHDYNGPPYTYEEPHWQRFFGGIADQLVSLFDPRTAYDAGCAKGFLVRALAERGVDARGGDISQHAIEGAPAGLAERLEVKDLTEPFADRYDLFTCIEVLEHMSSEDARLAVANLCAATDVVVLSTTPEDFADPTHINIRQAAGWAQEFAVHGFYRAVEVDAGFLSPWAVVFRRAPFTQAQLVTRYETLLAPVLREVQEKRRALLEARRQLDEASAPVMVERDALLADRDTAVHERNELAARLNELDGDAVRAARLALVDELIGVKAELAQTRVHAEYAIAEAGRDAERLRAVLTAAQEESAAAHEEYLRSLAETDRIAAERDRTVLAVTGDRDQAVAAVKRSASWRIGQTVLLPVRLLRRARRR